MMSTTVAEASGAEGVPARCRPTAADCLARARAIASSTGAEERLGFARAVVLGAVRTYWKQGLATRYGGWRLRQLTGDVELGGLSAEAEDLAAGIGEAAAAVDALEAGYMIGLLYTATMPDRLRTRLGAYYTPPALCGRLLDMATDAGVNWSSARVLDPACGGGAFLAPVALRMADSLPGENPGAVLESIERRLVGFELDPFAAWLSKVFLDVALMDRCRAAGRRLRAAVRVCDSLERQTSEDRFDLVVGNPPYGRVRLSRSMREKFARSLFGHANLYGVFTDLALRLAREGGVVAYVTPTSFLSGEYFKALRGLLAREAPPVSIDFIGRRKGVFADVLQETLLAAYRRGGNRCAGNVHFITPGSDGSIETVSAGRFELPAKAEEPWLMPRSEAQGALLERVGGLMHRLEDWGYTVSTGPLVWNRHKGGLRERRAKRRYPLIWAESVRPDGRFEFRAQKRNHKPYFEPGKGEQWVVTDFACVLVQRTTAKEQCRRLIAAVLPAPFLEEHGAVVVENHLNMVRPQNGTPEVAPAAVAAVLNSNVADQVFRCINGSVAVSAYELAALPLPAPEGMGEIEALVARGAGRDTIEKAVARAYGCGAW